MTGLRTCWLGFIRNTVARNVNFNDNRTAAQSGDFGGSPNTVGRKATGQCVKLT